MTQTNQHNFVYKIYGDMLSGNCYKIKLLMQFLNIEHKWIHVDILAGKTHTKAFKLMNPNARIPVIDLGHDRYLWESNAILHYFANGTNLLPADRYLNAEVLQWQFFEQYSHEPYIATARYINKYLGLPEERKAEYYSKQSGGHHALKVMNDHLANHQYFVDNKLSIADISLYAYTHVAHEGGFDLSAYIHIIRWLKDFETTPNYIKMARNNA